MKKFSVLLLVLPIIFLSACQKTENFVVIGNKKINVELARTDEDRKNGLMFRESLCQNCGMLFIFDEENLKSFWMKNTLIPLSMIFIDSDQTVVNIENATPCETETCPSYESKKPAKYVLEVNQNIFDQEIIGTKVKINY